MKVGFEFIRRQIESQPDESNELTPAERLADSLKHNTQLLYIKTQHTVTLHKDTTQLLYIKTQHKVTLHKDTTHSYFT
jgi:hypothetical protein